MLALADCILWETLGVLLGRNIAAMRSCIYVRIYSFGHVPMYYGGIAALEG